MRDGDVYIPIEGFELPVLRGAALAEEVESADPDQRLHFFRERVDAEEEIGEGTKGAVLALARMVS